MKTLTSTGLDIVLYTKRFLESEKKDQIEQCYRSIRDKYENRYYKNTIEVLNDEAFDALFPLVSNVVLTANKIECDSFNYIASKKTNSALKRRKGPIRIIPDHTVGVAEAYLFNYEQFYILHLNAFETGSNTPGGSADIVRFITNNPFLNPSSIISFGVCYGRDPNTQNIGDVIIPQKLYPWSVGQKITNKKITIKHDNFNLWLYNEFNESGIYPILNDYCNGVDGTTIFDSVVMNIEGKIKEISFSIKTTMGNLSTGEAVVSSAKAKKLIRIITNNEKEMGGEMEGYGLAKECIYYSRIPCIIIKSICDWGELKNIDEMLKQQGIPSPKNLKDKFQSYASFCAGLVFFNLLAKEKDRIVIPKLYLQIKQTPFGANFLKGNTVCSQQKIIQFLKKFYNGNLQFAAKVFDILLKEKILIESTIDDNKYRINQLKME